MGAQNKLLVELGLNNTKNIDDTYINNKIKEIRKKVCNINDKDKVMMLLKTITYIDLTSLNIDDTPETIESLCLKAIKPIAEDLVGSNTLLHTAAVCVCPARVNVAIDTLNKENARQIFIASVAADFPLGKLPFEIRLKEIIDVTNQGVDEIDLVIDRSLVLTHDWDELFNQLSQMRVACKDKRMKTILSVGDLPSLNHVYKASMVAMAAGTDFIKTSTGKENVNATLPAGIIMCQAIKHYYEHTGRKVGFKPAGGIKTFTQALEWLILVEELLGDEWLNKESFRIGASSLLDDIVKAIQ
ncbi:hypothetical protein PV328_009126 [Microctonus aethiopoides]|uniref:deoxyribose-phosphate aldolase n=1 Tax=Microctonus aethiopoides TaxID=144406 RepID=A0AA39KRY8_9HYME|nr:hypothetical protein PV328_009126 [Microctonus aethiopoides]